MKKVLLVLLIGFVLINTNAQEKKNLTIKDAVIGQWRELYPEFLNGAKWKTNEKYTYVNNWTSIVEASVKSDKTETILTISDINSVIVNEKLKAVRYFSEYEWLNDNVLQITHDNHVINYNIISKKLESKIALDKKAEHVSICKANGMVAYTIDNNLFVVDKNSKQKAVTNDTDDGIVNGNSYVHREEFGINNGIFWSPKGKYLAFYRKDETMVAKYPLVDYLNNFAVLIKNKSRYPMAGQTSEHVKLGIYNIKNGKTIFVKTGKPEDQYLTAVTWGHDEKYIYIGILNRGQNHLKLNKYDAKTGKFVKTLFEEKHDKYVEPEHGLIFMKKNPEQFLWQSENDGYNHLYIYNTDGKKIKQLTKGKWIVTEFLGFDEKGKNIIIKATKESPLENHLYMVNIKSKKISQLSESQGKHTSIMNDKATYFIDSYSNYNTPYVANIISSKGKIVKNILTSKNPLKNHNLGEMNVGTIKAADNKTDLYYRIIKPINFNKKTKYPVIVYVYGGPHAQMVTNTWLGGARMWQYYMAQKGYIVFTLDNRGSANRGFEFENVIHRQLGVNEMADQMKGIEYLKSLSYVDTDRIGVNGWSFGGFMTISLMANQPDVFKVGVAGGPVTDWKFYEVMYGERYMDTPQENPDGYKKTSLLNKAGNIKGELLIIHGVVDPVVVIQNSMTFIRECVKEGVLLDFFPYSAHEHNVRGGDRLHLMRKITKYFDDYLK